MSEMLTLQATLLPLPYMADSMGYFENISTSLPMALLLQSDPAAVMGSSTNDKPRGRFDIITAAPDYWLETHKGIQSWKGDSVPSSIKLDETCSFGSLHQLIHEIQTLAVDFSQCEIADLPFCGGLIGYCSYDLGREYIALPPMAERDIDIPEMQFGFYAWACIQDHYKQQSWLVIHPSCKAALRKKLLKVFEDCTDILKAADIQTDAKVAATSASADITSISECSYDSYASMFVRAQDYIQSGDCYQVNLSQRFSASTTMFALDLYKRFRRAMPSPFCSFLPVLGTDDDSCILSMSPEKFISIDPHGRVISQPIKGTAKRSSDPMLDTASAHELEADSKNRAENLMIVDLLRNDLGKVCAIGSIKVSKLFELQSFSNVHHLVSTIEGHLLTGLNGADVLKACFPGGSITGTPKIRSMEIIEELEPTRRSIYCGSIALFSAHGAMDSNILIRTVLLKGNELYCWGGGGIVADSVCENEYKESILKVKPLLDMIHSSR